MNLPTPFPHEPPWPQARAPRILFLVDASSPLEEEILGGWVGRSRPEHLAAAAVDVASIPPTRRRRRQARVDPRLEETAASGEEVLLAPLRVAWLPAKRDGVRAARWSDLLTLGDPRDPGRLRAAWTVRKYPDRCRIVSGEPATLAELRSRWSRVGEADAAATLSLPDFIARQAALALDRAERKLRGARYKVPRFVNEDILARPSFRGGVARIARELSRPETAVLRQAARHLREIAATHDPYVIDLAASLIRLLYTQGYSESLRVDHHQLEGIASLGQRHPVIFLPSHKSNLDHLVLQYALHECGLPPNHTAGGINMNFFPVGPLVRRSGVFFIRRSFKDNRVYKFVLRSYVDYLIEKRFPLEWYIEGGRSRSGKLLPPRFGMLSYVVDSWRRGRADDVVLIPVSIAYDQISDVADYAAEQRGAAKQSESFGWFLGVIRRMRRRYGDIHIRFGEPLSLARTFGEPEPGSEPDSDGAELEVQKLAFEVCVRINRATPITPTSLVTLTLLGTGDRAMTVEEIGRAMRNLIDAVRQRKLPTTQEIDELETPDGVQRALRSLQDSGVVSCFDEGPEAVYSIQRDQHLTAAYYRNSIAHFFVNGAIGELALLHASAAPDPEDAFWREVMRLRDLLKFDFFFPEKDAFVAELRQELALRNPDWERRLAEGPEAIGELVRSTRPFSAHRVLRPFFDAYHVVADALARLPESEDFDRSRFLDQCLALGRQYLLRGRIRSPESVSKTLFETGLRLAENRGLAAAAPDVPERRKAFAAVIRDAVRRTEAIDVFAAARRAGLMD